MARRSRLFGRGPCFVKNVSVTGFDTGIATKFGVNGIVFEHITLRGDFSAAESKKERYDEMGFTVVKFNEINAPLSLQKQE